MSDYFVREDTSHGATRDGLAYATAWGGWDEITWGAGAANVSGGDTLYVCGAHAYSATKSVGAHLGAAEATRCAIRGDHSSESGSLTFTGASHLGNDRAWTTITNLPITAATNPAIFASDTATNSKYLNNALRGTNATSPLISLYAITGQDHADILIDGNSMTGIAAAGVQWLCAAAGAVSTLSRVTITNNSCEALTVTNGVVNLRAENDTSQSSIINDLVIEDNDFSGVTSASGCIKVGSDYTVFGLCKGLKIRGNTLDAAGAGGCAPHAWGNSATPGFGRNEISRNTIKNMVGVTGGINLFDSTALIEHNVIEDFSSATIDANGILLDIGCAGVTVRYNEINRCLGKEGVVNSGYAVMVLACTDVEVYGNFGDGNRNGIHLGNAGAAQSVKAWNNTFTGLLEHAVYAHQSADLANCEVRNNLFIGNGYNVFDATAATWTGENYNCYFGFASGASNHTLGANSILTNPLIGDNYRIGTDSSCYQTGVWLPRSRDRNGRKLKRPPDIGAHQYYAPRTAVLVPRTGG